MAKRYGIQKGVIQATNKFGASTKGTYDDLNKILREILRDYKVAAYDSCCPDFISTGPGFVPLAYDSAAGVINYFNTTTEVWTDIVGGAEVGLTTFYPAGAQSNITAGTGGAIPITNYLTTINTDAGGDAFTLANATVVGQVKKIQLVVDGTGDGVVTPANLAGAPTTITFNDAGDYVILQWNGTDWIVIENSGTTVA